MLRGEAAQASPWREGGKAEWDAEQCVGALASYTGSQQSVKLFWQCSRVVVEEEPSPVAFVAVSSPRQVTPARLASTTSSGSLQGATDS